MTQDIATERAKKWLGSADLRPTTKRLDLARLLVGDGQHRHITADRLFAQAETAGISVSLATVYNTLKAFSDVGLLREITVDGAASYFDTNTHDHPHFYWEESGALSDASSEGLRIDELPAPPEGTEIAAVDIVIRLRKASS